MKETIEKLLKERVGTSFIYETDRGINVFMLTNYGKGIFIVHDTEVRNEKYTRILCSYPKETSEPIFQFSADIHQKNERFAEFLVESVKMLIELRKKGEKR